MIVDSSALIAVIKREPDSGTYVDALRFGAPASVGAPTLVEARLALTGLGRFGHAALDRVLERFEIDVLAFEAPHADRAHQAHQLYGRGSGHRAKLNFGDCMAYAVASVERRPLLFKGDDFIHTDIASVLDS